MQEIIERYSLFKGKKKVVLISPSQYSLTNTIGKPRVYEQYSPPISSMTVSANLEARGFETVIFDMRIASTQELELYFKEYKDDISFVGLTVYVGSYITAARELTILARNYGLKVVWGGPLTHVLPESCLKECDALGGTLNYSDALNWDKIKMNKEQKPYSAYLFTSTGCPYRCTFCYLQAESKKVNFRTAQSVIEEMDLLYNNYGISEFDIGDDNFFTDKKRSIEILDIMRKKGYTISKVICAQNDFTDEIINAMSGIVKIVNFSIESINHKIIKKIRKPVRLDKLDEIHHKLRTNNISIWTNIIIGWPFDGELAETEEDYRKIDELFGKMKENDKNFRGTTYIYTSLPETPLALETEEQYGKFPKDLDFWEDCDFASNPRTLKYRPWLTIEKQTELEVLAEELNTKYGRL